MKVQIDTDVVRVLGASEAYILEYIFTKAPHPSLTCKLNVSVVSRSLPISLRTTQRLIIKLTELGYLVKSLAGYSLTYAFFKEFNTYHQKINLQ